MRGLELFSQSRCTLCEFSRHRDFFDRWSQRFEVSANLAGVELRHVKSATRLAIPWLFSMWLSRLIDAIEVRP